MTETSCREGESTRARHCLDYYFLPPIQTLVLVYYPPPQEGSNLNPFFSSRSVVVEEKAWAGHGLLLLPAEVSTWKDRRSLALRVRMMPREKTIMTSVEGVANRLGEHGSVRPPRDATK